MSGVLLNPNLFGDAPGTLNLVTDFADSFLTWNAYQVANPGAKTLIVDAGTHTPEGPNPHGVLSDTGPGTQTILGANPSTTFIENLLDACHHRHYVNPSNENNPLPKIDTMLTGETVATLKDNVTDGPKFSVGQWVLLMAYDMQAFGYPQNNHFFEYRQIEAINTGTGEITLDAPVRHDYKDTYPQLHGGTGSTPDQCGPATLIPLVPQWDAHHVFKNMTINPTFAGAWYGAAREITWENCTFSNYGHIPTGTRTIRYTNCHFGAVTTPGFEFDKSVENVIFDGCQIDDFVTIQSSSIYNTEVNDCVVTVGWIGTPKVTTITNSTMYFLRVGPQAYGAAYSLTIDNCNITGSELNFEIADYAQMTHLGSGVFTAPKFADDILIRLIPDPGCWYFLTRAGHRISPAFQITDATYSSGTGLITYTTTLTGSEPQLTIATGIVSCKAPSLTVTNCTEGFYAPFSYPAAEGLAAGEYFNTGPWNPATVYGKTGGVSFVTGPRTIALGWLNGNLVQLTFTVTKPYTGTHSTLKLTYFGLATSMYETDGVTQSNWNPEINLKIAGTRVITPSGVTGQQSGDGGLALGNKILFKGAVAYRFSNDEDLSLESSSVWPEFEFELILDQGITV